MRITETKLPTDARRRLESARDSLQAALGARDKALARVGEVEAKKESLATEVRDARANLDPLNDADCEKFSNREKQLGLLEGELVKSRAAIAGAETEILRAAALGASALRSALQPVLEQKVEEASALFAPYYENPVRTNAGVRGSDFFICFHNRLQLLTGRVSVAEAENVFSWIDSTLAGSIGWMFWRGVE